MWKVYAVYGENRYALMDLEYKKELERYHIINPPTLSLEINNAGTFSFIMAPNNPNIQYIHLNLTRIEVYRNEDWYWEGRVTQISYDDYRLMYVTAYGALCYLSDSAVKPCKYEKVTAEDFLRSLIENHNSLCNKIDKYKDGMQRYARFLVGDCEITKKLTCYTGWETTLESISSHLIDNFGGYISIHPHRPDGATELWYVINYYKNKEISEDKATSDIELGQNLITYSDNVDTLDLCTAVIPTGKSTGESDDPKLDDSLTLESLGDLYVYNESMVKKYGWRFQVVSFSDISNVNDLLTEAQDYLVDYQFDKMVIKAQAVDMNFINSKYKYIEVGDVVNVRSKVDGQRITNIVSACDLNLLSPGEDYYTIGIDDNKSISGQNVYYNKLDGSRIRRQGVAYDDELIEEI